ncbi:MAG: hypothetical protein COA78_17960 [Blastopirellula sp.]|nr:MAG: hypothetical protein COA78_17960 [Blastopirellula sp.]
MHDFVFPQCLIEKFMKVLLPCVPITIVTDVLFGLFQTIRTKNFNGSDRGAFRSKSTEITTI